jgi:hypothetical protein
MATNTHTHFVNEVRSAARPRNILVHIRQGRTASRYRHAHLGGSICDSVNFALASVERTYEHIYDNANFTQKASTQFIPCYTYYASDKICDCEQALVC